METNNSKARFVRALEVIKEQLSRIGVETDIRVLTKPPCFPASTPGRVIFTLTMEDYEFSLDRFDLYVSLFAHGGEAELGRLVQ